MILVKFVLHSITLDYMVWSLSFLYLMTLHSPLFLNLIVLIFFFLVIIIRSYYLSFLYFQKYQNSKTVLHLSLHLHQHTFILTLFNYHFSFNLLKGFFSCYTFRLILFARLLISLIFITQSILFI